MSEEMRAVAHFGRPRPISAASDHAPRGVRAPAALPTGGGVFYIRGGYYNLKYPQQTPPIQNPSYPPGGLTSADIAAINLTKSGDDDHPSYSDSNLSESMAARVINAIASNPEIWAHSAIIMTYDESDDFYDHVPPPRVVAPNTVDTDLIDGRAPHPG